MTATAKVVAAAAGVLFGLPLLALAQSGGLNGTYVANDNSRLVVKEMPGRRISATLRGITVAARRSKADGPFTYDNKGCVVRFAPYKQAGRQMIAVEAVSACRGANKPLADLSILYERKGKSGGGRS